MEISIGKRTEVLIKEILNVEVNRIVCELSEKYGFDRLKGLEYVKIKNVELQYRNNKIPMPLSEKIVKGDCEGVRLNHSLYTQCRNKHCLEKDSYKLCKTCYNQSLKNSNGEPTYGYISERIKAGVEYRDPKGKGPVSYGNVMEKLNISREEAEREAENQGLTIPEEEFIVKKTPRGRPKKSQISLTTTVDTSGSEASVSDDESDEKNIVKKCRKKAVEKVVEKEKKPRGRPKKEKVIIESSGEDLIKDMIKKSQAEEKKQLAEAKAEEAKAEAKAKAAEAKAAEAKAAKAAEAKAAEAKATEAKAAEREKLDEHEDDDDDDEEEEEDDLEVIEVNIEGKKYFKAADNSLYDSNTHEEIGIWDPIKKVIILE